ncbi:MAG: hypothetical protein O7H41_20235 [Planctomycetota bacterium]|nr:hypothetical protein [Planctomycetota bacterium]
MVLAHGADYGRFLLFETFDPISSLFLPSGWYTWSGWSGFAGAPLTDGRVTFSGGFFNSPLIPYVGSQFWIYDPRSDVRLERAMTHSRRLHTATLLQSGEVIVVGGFETPSLGGREVGPCEIYDPVSDTLRVTAALPVPTGWHAAVLLSDGRLLVSGGYRSASVLDDSYESRCALFDPQMETWSLAAPLSTRRAWPAAVLLRDGRVLLVGGSHSTTAGGAVQPESTEIYEPSSDTWTPGPDLSVGRRFHTATLLNDGRVLVAGGSYYDPASQSWPVLQSVEILGPTFP